MKMKKRNAAVLAIVGPTATGKSALALALAEKYGGEIVCCDSMQVYKLMDVGTAKPTADERAAVPHHTVDFVDPRCRYSCAEYVADADAAIADVIARGKLPVICGGTGLYLDGLLYAPSYCAGEGETALRRELESLAETPGGKEILHARLAAADPESASRIHPNNVRRVIRAIEIYETTGVPKSEFDRRGGEKKYEHLVIGIRRPDREEQNRLIDERIGRMFDAGLVRETEMLADMGIFDANATAAQAIGYKEILGYIRGECGLAEARERLLFATRRYAKRQLTWFGAKKYVEWIDVTPNGIDPLSVAGQAVEKFFFD